MFSHATLNARPPPHQAALPALVNAAAVAAATAAASSPPRTTVHFADFGCSEGKNSVVALSAAAAAALGAGATAVTVTHVDLPANNWDAMAAAVAGAAGYGDSPAITVTAQPVDRGFYVACFPPATIDVVYASAAFHWASGAGLPATLPGGEVVPGRARDPAVAAACAAAKADDWAAILRHRAAEVRPGGRLVASQVVDDGPLDGVWACVETAWRSLLDDGTITAAEADAAVVRVHQRSVADWLAPLQPGGAAAGEWTVAVADTVLQTAPAYAALRAGTGTAAEYGTWVRLFFEAVSRPVFEAAVAARGEAEAARIVDAFYERLAHGVATATPVPPFVMGNLVLVLERK